MNTEQRLNELEKRVVSLEKFKSIFSTINKNTSDSQGPTIENVAKFITGQTTLPLDDSQEKTDPPTWLVTSDTTESDATNIASVTPDNTSGSDPAGQ